MLARMCPFAKSWKLGTRRIAIRCKTCTRKCKHATITREYRIA
jgi:hypothetical protein